MLFFFSSFFSLFFLAPFFLDIFLSQQLIALAVNQHDIVIVAKSVVKLSDALGLDRSCLNMSLVTANFMARRAATVSIVKWGRVLEINDIVVAFQAPILFWDLWVLPSEEHPSGVVKGLTA